LVKIEFHHQWDDWADSVAYFMFHEALHGQYTIDTHQGDVYDIMKRVESAQFAEKYEYLRQFFARTDIIYP
jgi:hypothetical protein